VKNTRYISILFSNNYVLSFQGKVDLKLRMEEILLVLVKYLHLYIHFDMIMVCYLMQIQVSICMPKLYHCNNGTSSAMTLAAVNKYIWFQSFDEHPNHATDLLRAWYSEVLYWEVEVYYVSIIQQTYFLSSVRYLIEADNIPDIIIIRFINSSLVDMLSIVIATVIWSRRAE